MKSSLKKLRDLAGHHKRDPTPKPAAFHLDDLAQAAKDMQDMRNCYDSLLSAAAAAANSAYEFSEALREMGSCLLEKTALNEDEESGRILLMLGKAQFELQKLVNSYRGHIIQTITTPSESLLNELKTVEDMKRQCDEKREVFDYMLATQKERSKSKNSKGETFSPQQLQAAREEYDNEATLFVFRLKSLRQGQSRSLLTQAARHHAAQLNFFRKGNISLEAIEPHVKLIAEKQHIDYHFSGLEDDGTEEDYGYDVIDDGELSFDYGQIEQGPEVVSTYRSSMELDQTDQISIPVSTLEIAQESLVNRQPDYLPFVRGSRSVSRSEPIFPEKKLEQVEKLEMRPSSKKFHTYVLPTPVGSKSSNIASSGPIPIARQQSTGGLPTQFWHSSPLGLEKSSDEKSLFPTQSLKAQSVLKESNTNSETPKIPPPLAEGLSFSRLNTNITSDNKKIKRLFSLSGPLMSKALLGKPIYAPMMSTAPLHVPKTKPSMSPRASPSASPPRMSSPRISELHELPRPPLSSGKITRPPSLIGHSAPLVPRGSEPVGTIKALSVSSHMAAPLPVPPGTIARSFSIPSSSQRAPSTGNKLLEARNMDITDRAASPPLTPNSLSLRPEPRRASVSDVQAIKPTSESYSTGGYHL